MEADDVESGENSPEPTVATRRRLGTFLTAPKPIGFFLFLLIAVTIVPALAIFTVLLQRNDAAQREVINTLAEAMAGSIAEAVDRELSGMITTLRVLSTTPSLAEDSMVDFYGRAKLALVGTGSSLALLDEHLDQIINTRVPFGTPVGTATNPEPIRSALSSRATTISGVFYAESSRRWVFDVILPYVQEQGPTRVLVMTRDAESLANTLSQEMLRGGWNASLVDRNGTVVASSFMSSNVGNPFFLDISGDAPSPQTAQLTEASAPQSFIAIVEESNYSGWKAVVWAPTTTIEQPVRRSLRMLFAGSLIVLAIGAAAAFVLGRQIAKPVRRLALDARKLGAGELVEPKRYAIAEVTTVSETIAEASADRKQAENEIRLLMREVAHRAKNQLTVVASMAKQTARNARSLPQFLDTFQKRLYGLARSTDLLIAGGAAGVELRELLLAQIEPFRPDEVKRMELSGPPFRLSNQAAQTIGLAIHELATNASKYGAFAGRTGRLSISWKVEQETLLLVWREFLPRLRRRPVKRGFGTEIIERVLGGTLDADISRDFHHDGLECIFRIPVKRVVPERVDVALPL